MLRYLFYNTVLARPVVQSKEENLQFYLGGVIWVTRLSRAFGYNKVFLDILFHWYSSRTFSQHQVNYLIIENRMKIRC